MRGAGPGARFLYSFIKSCTRQSEFKICCQGASPPLNSLPSVDGRPSADTAVRCWRRLYALGGRGHWPPSAAGECRPHGGGKRGKTTKVFFPLLTPQTFLRTRLPAVARLNGGRRGHASVRRAGFGTLLCPEFTLRYSPRITVRGQTVQGGSVPLRKAPLRSSVYSWSTKRPCGPLAF